LCGQIHKVVKLQPQLDLDGGGQLRDGLQAHRKPNFLEEIDRCLDLHRNRRDRAGLAGYLGGQVFGDPGIDIRQRLNGQAKLDTTIDLCATRNRDLGVPARACPVCRRCASTRKHLLVKILRRHE
jgi:hypothetical protein